MEKRFDEISASKSANIENDPRIKGVDERIFEIAKETILREKPEFNDDILLKKVMREMRPGWSTSIASVDQENVGLAEKNAAKSIARKILNSNDKK